MANTVLIISDEHNPFYSSVYGHPFVKTPNMERLARNGTLFRNAYCPSPLCLPSRSAFLAGRRVHDIQCYSNCNINLRHDFTSYGAAMDEQGVHSTYIGKTDVYDDGENLGFTEMIYPENRDIPGDVNFNRRPLSIRADGARRASAYGPREKGEYIKDLKMVDTAIEWISTKSLSLTEPWVLTVNVLNPHFPQYCTQELWDMYPEGENLPEYGPGCESANHPYARDLRDHFQTDFFSEEQVKGIRRGYLACITFVDQQIGRVIEALEKAGIIDSTNIIYTSDHGDMMGKFGMWWKCSLYEDSVRIPCIASGPDFKKGNIVNTPVDLLDVQASLFKATGAKRPEGWTGKPLQDIPEDDKERVVFSEYHGHGTRSGAYMIRKGDWKLVYYMEAPHQLFNLIEDPDELRNVYGEFPEKAAELEKELRSICSPEEENEKAHLFQDEQLKMIQQTRCN